MDEKPKKGQKRFKTFSTIIVIIFACIYIAGETGYYENKIANNTLLTSEAIIAFEKDVEAGKKVDIKDYIVKNNKDYRNVYSNTGYQISKTIDSIVNDGVGKIFKIIKSLFS